MISSIGRKLNISKVIHYKDKFFIDVFKRCVFTQIDPSQLKGGLMADVHGTIHGKKHWRNKPLFRREGDKRFRNGIEAADMLLEECHRKDPYQLEYPKYAWVMKQLMEPERIIQFRVPWVDDTGNHRVNRGFRVQYSSSVGPYVGGLRFHPQCGHGTVKFLGFENVIRNALAGGYGGAYGGSDFSPYMKSEAEVMRFCQSFMTELANYIGPQTDIPGAGVGVRSAEIGYMFGQYKRIRQMLSPDADGVLSGGQFFYPEITGQGVVHYTQNILNGLNMSLEGKRCLISGSGTVALSTAKKLIEYGAVPIALSDSSGYVVEPEGFTKEKLSNLIKIKKERNARIGGYIMTSTSAQYNPSDSGSIWDLNCDYAFPCALENNIDESSAKTLIKNGCQGVFEGANMACTIAAKKLFHGHKIAFGPSKALTAAPLSLYKLRSHNLTTDDVDKVIKKFMDEIYSTSVETASLFNIEGDMEAGTNIAGFMKVANAMLQQGAV